MLDIVVCIVKIYTTLDRYQNNFIEKAVMNGRGTICPGKTTVKKSRV
jgi:hypothetical protein